MDDKFAGYLQEYFSRPDSRKQEDIAEAAGISGGYLSRLVSGAQRGTEKVRRDVVQVLGGKYEEVVGDASPSPALPDGLSRPLPLCAAALERLGAAMNKDVSGALFLVPVVRLDAVFAGEWADGDVSGWVMARRRRDADSLVAVNVPDAPTRCFPHIPNVVAVVDTGDREPVDGAFYLLRPPARMIVAQVIRREGLYIITSCTGGGPGIQTLPGAQYPDLIIGRVVRMVYDLRGGGVM